LGIRLDAAHKPRLRRLQLGHQVAKRLDKLVADGRKRGLCLLLATATFLFGLGLAQVSYLWGDSAVVSTGGTLLVGVRGCSGCVRLACWIRVGAPRPLWRESHCSSRGSLRREVIRGHQRSSEVIRGHQRSSEVIRGSLRRHALRDARWQSTQRTRLLLIARKVDDFAREVLDEKVVLLPALLRLAHLRSTEDRCGLLTVCLVQARAKGLTGSIGCLAGGIEQLEDATRGVLAQVDDLLVVLVCDWRPCDALCADERRSKAIRGDQARSGAIRGNQARSEAIRGDQRRSEPLAPPPCTPCLRSQRRSRGRIAEASRSQS